MRKYKAVVLTTFGLASVRFTSGADTRRTILEDAGRAVARRFGDEYISIVEVSTKEGLFPWSRSYIEPTLDENVGFIYRAAREFIAA